MLLDIPSIIQRGEYDCGIASIEAIFKFHNIKNKVPTKLANPAQGMAPDTVEAILRSANLGVLSGNMTITDLRHFTRDNRPVLCPVTSKEHGGHWVIVRGIERNKVHFHCPVDGPSNIGMKEWIYNWQDTAYTGAVFCSWGIVAFKLEK